MLLLNIFVETDALFFQGSLMIMKLKISIY